MKIIELIDQIICIFVDTLELTETITGVVEIVQWSSSTVFHISIHR